MLTPPGSERKVNIKPPLPYICWGGGLKKVNPNVNLLKKTKKTSKWERGDLTILMEEKGARHFLWYTVGKGVFIDYL